MRQAITQDTPGAAAGRAAFFLVVADPVIEKALDPLGRGQTAEDAQLAAVESV